MSLSSAPCIAHKRLAPCHYFCRGESLTRTYPCVKIQNFSTNEYNCIKKNTQAGTAYTFISAFANVTISVVLITKSKYWILKLHNYKHFKWKTGTMKNNYCTHEFENIFNSRMCASHGPWKAMNKTETSDLLFSMLSYVLQHMPTNPWWEYKLLVKLFYLVTKTDHFP